ncbi:MAG: hypothetical protein IJI74_02925 [Firmicutes bacterium]|nr:hypothetical protein [Bacillota bacterium]
MIVKQVSVFVENETGRLAKLMQVLEDNGVDLNAATIAETGEYGILRCIVQNPDETVEILKKNNFLSSITNVIAVTIENRPGGLNAVLKILAAAGIAVKYIYSTIQSLSGNAVIMMKVEDPEKAAKLLTEKGVKLFCLEDLK